MKKVLVILLLFAHLFSTVGFSMDIHHCGPSKTYSILGIELGEECCCDHDEQTHEDDCCKDEKLEVKSLKKENVPQKTVVFKQTATEPCLPPGVSEYLPVLSIQAIEPRLLVEHPPDHSPPIYLLHQVFRI